MFRPCGCARNPLVTTEWTFSAPFLSPSVPVEVFLPDGLFPPRSTELNTNFFVVVSSYDFVCPIVATKIFSFVCPLFFPPPSHAGESFFFRPREGRGLFSKNRHTIIPGLSL